MKTFKKLSALLSCFIIVVGIAKATSTPFPCTRCTVIKGKVQDIYGNWITCPDCNGSGYQPENEQSRSKATSFPEKSSQSKTENSRLEPTKFPETKCSDCGGKGGWYISGRWVQCNKCKNK